jgi:hypothetical protein
MDLNFKEVCNLIKKDEPKLIDAVDRLVSLAVIFSPVVLGPAAAALLPLLSVKNELVKMGKYVFDSFVKKEDSDYLAKQQRMQVAYSLLVFTSFFEALDRKMPKEIRDRIGSLDSEKMSIAESATGTSSSLRSESFAISASSEVPGPLVTQPLVFPHPTESLSQQVERHNLLWQQMAQAYRAFLHGLPVWEEIGDKKLDALSGATQKLPEAAAAFFEAQYFELARRYEDFAVWANLQEHKRTKGLIESLSAYVQRYAALSTASKEAIDIGFSELHNIVVSIPETLKVSQAAEIVESLKRNYDARVTEPLFEEKDEPEEGKPRLSFPRVSDAFIPQSFQVLRQSAKAKRFEDEVTWHDLSRRDDLGAFLLSYLSSPYSTETPLVILGHPGSGKSLLTTVLAAKLTSDHYTAIRVPLREVDAEAGIVAQIEQRIRQITGLNVDSWARLSGTFKNSPPIIILDGYDELLQASGKVFSGYLKDVQNFQKNEVEQGRPVRVIVTSRVTLIDKATIPQGSTILRLLEFDARQQGLWVSIWNSTNSRYFRDARIEEFALPNAKDPGAEKILSLAEQPLLLLLLALYDSQDNKLRKSKALDRTILYDSLLRQFLMRERGKEKGFDYGKSADRSKALDVEMQRLGVAAVGMYNRRSLHILSQDLNDDLKFFNLEREITVASGTPMSQADLLLGSFFFVHKSRAQHQAGATEYHEEKSAFEFLHNTFGEFLTADFIVRRTMKETESLKAYKQSEDVLREKLEKLLSDADGFSREWFASLVYTPLFTRPVVLDMIREWVGHALNQRKLTRPEFLSYLDIIVLNQIKRLLSKREMPSIIRKETAQEGYRAPFGDHPLLGHIAIYSLNLILLRLIVSDSAFVFDEDQIDTHEDGTRPWDRLTYIWRSWFALDNLNGITAVMIADRKGPQVTIQAKKVLQVAESQNRLRTCLSVAISLGDNISSGLAGLLTYDLSDNQLSLEDITERLASERLDLEFQITMRDLFRRENRISIEGIREFISLFDHALQMAVNNDKHEELEGITLSLERAIGRASPSITGSASLIAEWREFFRGAVGPGLAVEVATRNPRAGIILHRVAKQLAHIPWQREFFERVCDFYLRSPMEVRAGGPDFPIGLSEFIREVSNTHYRIEGFRRGMRFGEEFFERVLDPRYLLELSERNPEAALAMLQLARQLGGGRSLEHFVTRSRFGEEFFERVLDPRYLLELSERNPEAALAMLQLARELGGERFLEHFATRRGGEEFFERVLDPRYLLKLSERNPEAALAMLQLARELAGGRFLEQFVARSRFGEEFFERALDPGYLLELSERNPEAVLAMLQLARELGGERFLEHFVTRSRFGEEFFERVLDPRYLLELSERNPEAALAMLQLARELGGERLREGFGNRSGELVERASIALHLNRKPAALAVLLRLVRVTESPEAIEAIAASFVSFSSPPAGSSAFLGSLPMTSLSDFQWLAKKTRNPQLNSVIGYLLRDDESY